MKWLFLEKSCWKHVLWIQQLGDTAEYEDGEGELKDNDHEEPNDNQHNSNSSLKYSDKEPRRYDEKMEEIFDRAYERIVATKGGYAKQKKRVMKFYEVVPEPLLGSYK